MAQLVGLAELDPPYELDFSRKGNDGVGQRKNLR